MPNLDLYAEDEIALLGRKEADVENGSQTSHNLSRYGSRYIILLATAGASLFCLGALASLGFQWLAERHSVSVHLWPHRPAPAAGSANKPVWMLATMTYAEARSRRDLIRASWQHLYPTTCIDDMHLEYRFVFGNSDAHLDEIKSENATFGDLLVLQHVPENRQVANTVKTAEFIKTLVASGSDLPHFLTKIDDDSFLDLPRFYQFYIRKYLKMADMPVLIGRGMQYNDFPYAGGQLYTMNRAFYTRFADLYTKNPIDNRDEDVLNGQLMHDAGEKFILEPLGNREAFDYDPKVQDATAWTHAVLPGALNPHKMKTDEAYAEVADLYTTDGLDLDRVPHA